MNDRSVTGLKAALVAVVGLSFVDHVSAADMSLLTGTPSPVLATKAAPAFLPDTSTGHFWAEINYLNWTVQGARLPALVTTSPAGTPQAQTGVLGAPGTTSMFGDSEVNSGWRSGTELQAGYWFDRQQMSGVEASAFGLQNMSYAVATSSDGLPAMARPFFNTATNQQDAQVIAMPGAKSGSANAREVSRMLGAGAVYRQNIWSWGGHDDRPARKEGAGGASDSFWGSGHVGVLVGYRYRYASDRLDMTSTTTSGPITVSVSDSLSAANNFHGLDVGLSGDFGRGALTLEWRAKVALGADFNDAHISGSTASTNGGVTTITPGGLLAPAGSIGHSSRTRFSAIPEIGLKAGYKLTPNWQVVAGYSAMYWAGVQRADDLINTNIDPNAPPPGGQGGGGPPPGHSQLVAQGFTFGLKYAY